MQLVLNVCLSYQFLCCNDLESTVMVPKARNSFMSPEEWGSLRGVVVWKHVAGGCNTWSLAIKGKNMSWMGWTHGLGWKVDWLVWNGCAMWRWNGIWGNLVARSSNESGELSLQTSLPKPDAITATMSSLPLSAEGECLGNVYFLLFIVVDPLTKEMIIFCIHDIFLGVVSGIHWTVNF